MKLVISQSTCKHHYVVVSELLQTSEDPMLDVFLAMVLHLPIANFCRRHPIDVHQRLEAGDGRRQSLLLMRPVVLLAIVTTIFAVNDNRRNVAAVRVSFTPV